MSKIKFPFYIKVEVTDIVTNTQWNGYKIQAKLIVQNWIAFYIEDELTDIMNLPVKIYLNWKLAIKIFISFNEALSHLYPKLPFGFHLNKLGYKPLNFVTNNLQKYVF
jgi:hypothetical protein